MGETVEKATSALVARRFTRAGDDIYKMVDWVRRQVELTDASGKKLLDKEIEAPDSWSDTAVTIAAYKYLRKRGVRSPEGFEDSVRQLVYRVAHTIRVYGEELRHLKTKDEADTFEDELSYILMTQRAAFNSPVWFNVGLWHEYQIKGHSDNFFWNEETEEIERAVNAYEHPQGSACFIQAVADDLGDIFDLVKKESRLFKLGSGTGTNFSALRSKYELLSGGGTSSGVMNFLNVLDAGAAATKSGGTTRRAAKMVILNVSHPEIMDFIHWKAKEEDKAKILIEYGGLPSDFNGEAYATVGGQNSNNSVRVTDDFMQAYLDDKDWETIQVTTGKVQERIPARKIMGEIAKSAWRCADPGMQFDTMSNKWHTCKASGRINGSNPCSEYMFLDDSACNLASINLVKFMDEDGKFNVEAFRHTVDVMILAQEIIVGFSSYPSRSIAQNSHDFRPLGLGYANIGAYLMQLGLPYDSEPGRALTAAITAIMTGRAYAQSAKMVERVGTFAEYDLNRTSMMEVIGMHKNAAYKLDAQNLEGYMFEAAKADWDMAYDLGEKYGFRNAQTTVLAPTGTIGPLMDVDTTGVEPDFALVKYKKLAGGSGYSIVNQSVAPALERMGYAEEEIKAITDYVLAKGKIEGAPDLKDEHVVVFDCANRCADGERFIRPMAHVEMMAAVQPFLSGAISKTVNMPEEVTMEDVEQIYIESWKKGLKAVALYRDNCKASQPLNSNKEEKTKVDASASVKVILPKTRNGVTHQFMVGGHKIYLIANTDMDGRLGEIFIRSAKEGSMVGGLLNAIARLLSKSLQSGESAEALISSMMNMRFEPWGATDDNEIPFAKSILDYIGRWLGRKFLPLQKQVMLGIIGEDVAKALEEAEDEAIILEETVPEVKIAPIAEKPEPMQAKLVMDLRQNGDVMESSAPPCPTCGALMIRNGTCYACRECGTTTGCS